MLYSFYRTRQTPWRRRHPIAGRQKCSRRGASSPRHHRRVLVHQLQAAATAYGVSVSGLAWSLAWSSCTSTWRSLQSCLSHTSRIIRSKFCNRGSDLRTTVWMANCHCTSLLESCYWEWPGVDRTGLSTGWRLAQCYCHVQTCQSYCTNCQPPHMQYSKVQDGTETASHLSHHPSSTQPSAQRPCLCPTTIIATSPT